MAEQEEDRRGQQQPWHPGGGVPLGMLFSGGGGSAAATAAATPAWAAGAGAAGAAGAGTAAGYGGLLAGSGAAAAASTPWWASGGAAAAPSAAANPSIWQQAGQWANNPWVRAGLGAAAGYFQGRDAQQGGSQSGSSSQYPYMHQALDPLLQELLQGQQGLYRQAMAGQGGGGGGGGGAPYGSAPRNWGNLAPDYGAADMMTRAGNAGLGFTANDPFMQAGLGGVQQLLGTQGASGMAGYNPLAESLARSLGGVGLGESNDLLRGFIGQGYGAQAPGGTLGGGSSQGGLRGPGSSYTLRATGQGPATYGGGGGGGGGGIVPDATGNGLFGQQVRQIFDQEANEQVLGDLIGSMSQDAMDAHWRALADLDAQAQGGGRLGSSWYNAARSGQQGQLDRAIAGTSAGIRYEDLENRRQAIQQALTQVNVRDLGAMQDRTQRYGIDASSAAAGAGTAAAMEAARLQHALGLRGQDLSAIGMMQGGALSGMGMMQGLAGLRSGDFGAGLGAAQGFGQLGLGGMGLGLGAGQGLGDLQLGMGQLGLGAGQLDLQRRGQNMAASNQAANRQQNALSDALRTYATVGSMGGTGSFNNAYPGQGGNPLAAALMAGIGGWLSAPR